MFSGKDSIEIQLLPLFGEKRKLPNFFISFPEELY